MIQEILSDENILLAIQHISAKGDKVGIDGICPSQLQEYWDMNQQQIKDAVFSFSYEPFTTQQFEQLNKKGKKRKITRLGTFDRMLSRAIVQVLAPTVDEYLSDRCFSYRAGRSPRNVAEYAADEIRKGNIWVAETDIMDFLMRFPMKNWKMF